MRFGRQRHAPATIKFAAGQVPHARSRCQVSRPASRTMQSRTIKGRCTLLASRRRANTCTVCAPRNEVLYEWSHKRPRVARASPAVCPAIARAVLADRVSRNTQCVGGLNAAHQGRATLASAAGACWKIFKPFACEPRATLFSSPRAIYGYRRLAPRAQRACAACPAVTQKAPTRARGGARDAACERDPAAVVDRRL